MQTCPKVTPPGYNLCQQPQEAHHGVGLGFYVKDGLDPTVVPTKACTTSSTPTVFELFQSLLEDIHHTTENLVIISNFSFYLETRCSNLKTVHSLIDSFDFIQKVNFPTHIHEHTLDLVLTKSNNDNISNDHTTDAFSDNFSISFTLNFSTPSSQSNATVTFDKEKMKTDLLASKLLDNLSKEANTLYQQYHSTFSTLIDKHAAPHTKHTKAKYIPGCVNETVQQKRPSIFMNAFVAEINLHSIDPNT